MELLQMTMISFLTIINFGKNRGKRNDEFYKSSLKYG